MAISLYDLSAVNYLQVLDSVSTVLKKGAKYAADSGPVLAMVLFAVEVFTTTGLFIGIALSSLAMAAFLAFSTTMPWEAQLGLFGFLSVAFNFLYFKFYRRFNDETDTPLLNNRAAQLVGETFTLQSDIIHQGAVMIHDTRWLVRCEVTLKKGSRVTVVGADGMSLLLRRSEAR
jgi:membrane protein implicated in regulation of membrane protease activity